MTLNYQELSTVLAALRVFQEGYDESTGESEYSGMSHFDDVEPLTNDQIDELCERLNCEPSPDRMVALAKTIRFNAAADVHVRQSIDAEAEELAKLVLEKEES